MEIKINNKNEVMEESALSVEKLLQIRKVENPDMVSVQLNGEFVLKEDYPQKEIHHGDEIDFLYFMGGGAL